MLLSQITADPSRFQKRGKPFSEATVSAIVASGIDLAKYDPIPIFDAGDGRWTVGGDGHSRFVAIQQLAAASRLPDAWCIDGDSPDWDIPCRIVTEDEAERISWTANLSHDLFDPVEEARVYAGMLEAGFTLEEIASEAHKPGASGRAYIRRMLLINTLCADIRERIGKPVDAGGIEKSHAQIMAEEFARYGINAQGQQHLFHNVFSTGDVSPQTIRSIIKLYGNSMKQSGGDSLLFELPPNVKHVIAETKARSANVAKADKALTALVNLIDTGAIDGLPQLKALLQHAGESMLQQLKYESDADGAVIGKLCLVA